MAVVPSSRIAAVLALAGLAMAGAMWGHVEGQSGDTDEIDWPSLMGNNQRTNSDAGGGGELGNVVWSTFVGQDLRLPAYSDGTLFLAEATGTVHALDASDGEKQWEYDAGARIYRNIVVAEGLVYIGTSGGDLKALDAETGQLAWQYHIGGKVGTPAVAEGKVYAFGDGLVALDASTGAFKWKWDRGQSGDAPLVADGLVYANDDRYLWTLDAETGRLENEDYNFFLSWPAAEYENKLYLQAGQVIEYNPRTRDPNWAGIEQMGYDIVPMVTEEAVYSTNGTVVAYERSTGETIWRFDDPACDRTEMALSAGTIYLSGCSHLLAIDALTGVELDVAAIDSRAIIVAGDRLFGLGDDTFATKVFAIETYNSEATDDAEPPAFTSPGGGGGGPPVGPWISAGPDIAGGRAPLPVLFSVDGGDYDGRPVIRFEIEFGDGQREQGEWDGPFETTHVYEIAGNYEALIHLYFANGDRVGQQVDIVVEGFRVGPLPNPPGDRWAFVVGIDEYTKAAFRCGEIDVPEASVKDLRYTVADANRWNRLLRDVYGFPTENIRLTKDTRGDSADDVEAGDILAGLEWLAASVGPSDLSVIFVASHGFGSREPEHIVAHSSCLSEFEFLEKVQAIPGATIVVLDVSWAGGLLESEMGRGIGFLPLNRTAVLVGCESHSWDLSVDCQEFSPLRHLFTGTGGVFSTLLDLGFRGGAGPYGSSDDNLDGRISVGEAFRFARRSVPILDAEEHDRIGGGHFHQVPQTYSGFDGEIFLNNVAPPASIRFELHSPAVMLVTAPSGDQVGLDQESGEIKMDILGAEVTEENGLKVIRLPGALPGEYGVDVIGTGEGEYKLVATVVDIEGARSRTFEYSGTTAPGQVDSHRVIAETVSKKASVEGGGLGKLVVGLVTVFALVGIAAAIFLGTRKRQPPAHE